MAGQTVQVSVLADTKPFASSMKGLSGAADGFGGTLKKLAGPIAAAFAVDKIVGFAKGAVSAASDLQQSMGGVDAVFGKSSAAVDKFAANAAQSVGLSANSYNELATVIGSQLKNGGVPLDQIAGKTNNLIKQGADMAAVFGGPVSSAVDAISSALKGERDPIERYGVSLNQAKIDAEAAALGFTKVGGTYDTTAQQAATLALITQQTAATQGQFGQQTNTLAEQQQILASQFTNVKAKLGNALLPALTAGATLLTGTVMPAFAQLADKAAPAVQHLVDSLTHGTGGFGAFASGVGSIAGPIGNVASLLSPLGILLKALGPVLPPLGAAFLALGQALGGALTQILPTLVQLIGTLVSVLSGVLAQILPVIVTLLTTVVGAITPILPVVGQLAQVLGAALGSALQALAPLLVQVVQAAGSLIVALLPLLPALVGILSAVLPLVPALVQLAVTALQPVIAIITALLPVVTGLVQVLVAILVPALNIVTAVFGVVVGAITGFIGFLTGKAQPGVAGFGDGFNKVWKGIQDFVSGVVKGVQSVISTVFGAIGTFISTAVNVWLAYVKAAWTLISTAVSTAVNAVKLVISTVFSAIAAYIQTVVAVWSAVISTAWGVIKSVVSAAIGVVKTVIETGLAVVKALFSGNWGAIPGIISGAVGKVGGIVSGLVSNVVGLIRGLGGKVTGAVSNFGSLLLSAGKNLVTGLINGIKGMIAGAVSTVTDLAGSVVKAAQGALGIHSPSTVFKEIGEHTGQGFINGLLGKKNEIDSSVASTMGGLADKVSKYFDDLPGKITKSQAQLKDSILAQFDDIAKSLDKQADKRAGYLKDLDDEKTKLDAAKAARTAYSDTLRDNLIAIGDVTKVKAPEGEALSAQNLIGNLQQSVNNTKEFKGLFDQLKSMGLDQTTLMQITNAYQQSGDLSFAKTIADGGKNAIAQISSLQGQLKSAGTSLGTDTSKTFFDSGVQVAKGLVDGVKSQISAVEDAMEAIAKKMTKKIKKSLGIKSPSRVFKSLGVYTVQGLEAGLSAPNNVTSLMSRLSDQVVDGYGATLDSSYSAYGNSGSSAPVINISVDAMTDGPATGRRVAAALDDYYRLNGRRAS